MMPISRVYGTFPKAEKRLFESLVSFLARFALPRAQNFFVVGINARPQEIADFDRRVDGDVPTAIARLEDRTGTARSTFPEFPRLS